MKIAGAAAVVAAFLFSIGAAVFLTAEPSWSVAEEREPSWMMPGDKGCSGVHIGGDLVLTANHCVGGAYDAEAFSLMWRSDAYDVALLRANEPMQREAASLACREPVVGEIVHAITFPGLRGAKRVAFRSEGVVGSRYVESLFTWRDAILVNISASHGSSGGPVYDAGGNVLGIVVGGFTPWGNMTIVVPSSILCRLLGRARQMPAQPISDELAAEAAAALKEAGGVKRFAAQRLGIPETTFYHRLKVAAARGIGGYVSEPAPPGYTIKGHSTYYDSNGAVRGQWVKTTREEGERQAEWLAAIGEVCERIKGFAFLPPRPKESEADLLVVYPRPDLHIGLYAWGEETGQDWSVDIATKALGDAASYLIASAPPAETALVLGLGDFFHADNTTNRTPRSGAELDVDTRYARVMRMGLWLEIAKVQLALQRHQRVIYKALAGNHDPHSAIALSLAVGAFFHSEPRVSVDQCPKSRWYFEWGNTLIGATHGHTVKQTDLPLLMAADMPEAWGRARVKRYYTGHLHHLAAKEHGGVVCEQFQSPAARDAYHAAGPWVSGRGMVAITFHRTKGEIGRVGYSLDMEAP